MTRARVASGAMMGAAAAAIDRDILLGDLTELVEALDRRTPSLERAGEARIVRDAAALKREAETRIAALRQGSDAPAEQPRVASQNS